MEGEIYKEGDKKCLSSLQEFYRSTQNRKLTENYNGRENYNERELYQGNLYHRCMTSKYSFMTHLSIILKQFYQNSVHL